MKKVIMILLCCAMIVGMVSCDKGDDISLNDIDTTQVTTNTSTNETENTSTYLSDEVYKDILNTYRELLLLKKNNINYDEIYIAQYQEESKIESAVFHAVLRNAPKKMGYSLKDLSGDGVDELILLDENYHFYTIFTVVNGQPMIVDDTFFGDGNHTGAIGKDGTIYKDGYGKGENQYAYIKNISENGALTGLEFGCLDINIDDIDIEYFKVIKGERLVIDYSEFEFLNEEYYRIVGNHTDLTKNSGIDFIRIELD